MPAVTSWSSPSIVKRARPPSDDVELLVAAGVAPDLVVLLDQLGAGVGGERVDAEGLDPERAAHEPVADPAAGDRLDLVEAEDARHGVGRELALGSAACGDLALGVGERADVGERGRLDDVGRDALAGGRLAGELEDDAGLAERVLAAGDRVDPELAQARLAPGGGVDGAEDRVDRAVAGEVALHHLVVRRADRDRGVRRPARGGLDVEPLERVGGHLGAELVGDERLEVHRGDLLLLVRDLLEALERGVQRLAGRP